MPRGRQKGSKNKASYFKGGNPGLELSAGSDPVAPKMRRRKVKDVLILSMAGLKEKIEAVEAAQTNLWAYTLKLEAYQNKLHRLMIAGGE